MAELVDPRDSGLPAVPTETGAQSPTLRDEIAAMIRYIYDTVDNDCGVDPVKRPDSAYLADALLPLVETRLREALEAAAQRVEDLPGPNDEGISKWHAKDQETYLLCVEEAAAAVRSGVSS